MSTGDGGLALAVPALYQWLEPALGPIAAAAVPVPTGPRSWWGGVLDVEGLALGSVQAAVVGLHHLAGEVARGVGLDAAGVAASFASLSLLRVEGRAPEGFALLSGFFPTAEGWVRTHANYPHHAAALQAALGVSDSGRVADALLELPALAVEDLVQKAGGIAAAVRTPADWNSTLMGRHLQEEPWIRFDLADHGGTIPDLHLEGQLAGLRVLDLTRVIAGPTGSRLLAALGADVLRIDPPQLPELLDQHIDTGFGKRSALADLRRPDELSTAHELLATADVLFTGYRSGALARYNLDPASLRDRHPQLAVVTLDAWGDTGPWKHHRGFDSIVQAATGIAHLYGITTPDGWRPGALPVQALDHATGYGMAAAALALLTRRARHEGVGHAHLSLAATAHQLLQLPEQRNRQDELTLTLQITPSPYGSLSHAPPPITQNGAPTHYPAGPDRYGTAPLHWKDIPT